MTKRIYTGLSMAGARATGAEAWAALPAPWCERLADLATACAGSFAEEEAERVRDLRELLAEAPEPSLIRGLIVPGSEQVESLIAAQASAAAVLAMFGPNAGYLLSRGATGLHAASAYLPGANAEVTAIGDSLALALVGAVAQALVDRRSEREPVSLDLN